MPPEARDALLEVAAAGGHRASEASVCLPSSGLVHTVSRWTSHFDEWAVFEQLRRLARMRRRTITRARVQAEEVQARGVPHHVDLVTLTYKPGKEWRPRHIRECMACYRHQAARDKQPFRYEWVAELQLNRMRRRRELAAECLHYHAIIWAFEGYSFPHPDSRGWWPHGMSNVERARNPVGYLAKYASKGTEGESLPRGARISGGGGLSPSGRQIVSWWLRPRYVREAFPLIAERVRRARGGGWINLDTGQWIAAPSFDWRTGEIGDSPAAVAETLPAVRTETKT
jgi:hypothetical protein